MTTPVLRSEDSSVEVAAFWMVVGVASSASATASVEEKRTEKRRAVGSRWAELLARNEEAASEPRLNSNLLDIVAANADIALVEIKFIIFSFAGII